MWKLWQGRGDARFHVKETPVFDAAEVKITDVEKLDFMRVRRQPNIKTKKLKTKITEYFFRSVPRKILRKGILVCQADTP